jgi:hypothetical protein
MPYDAEDIVDFVMNKDHLNLKAALDNIMASRVEDALELRKEYVGRQMFNPDPEEVETDDAE